MPCVRVLMSILAGSWEFGVWRSWFPMMSVIDIFTFSFATKGELIVIDLSVGFGYTLTLLFSAMLLFVSPVETQCAPPFPVGLRK